MATVTCVSPGQRGEEKKMVLPQTRQKLRIASVSVVKVAQLRQMMVVTVARGGTVVNLGLHHPWGFMERSVVAVAVLPGQPFIRKMVLLLHGADHLLRHN